METPQGDAHRGSPTRSEAAAQPGDMIDLGPVDRGILWSRLALTQTQLAELAGLSQRQVSRWAARGLLVPSSRDPDRFNGDSVELAILMQRAIVRGHRPTQAARMAQMALAKYLNDTDELRVSAGPDVREKLLAAQTAIQTALEILFPGGAAREQAQGTAGAPQAEGEPQGEPAE
jgi:hypothetical protein